LELAGDPARALDPKALLILEGNYLLHPRLGVGLDRVLFLETSPEHCLRRLAGRELPLGRQSAYERVRRLWLPAQERFDEACPPASRADRVLSGENPLGPPD